ncbi:MAG: PKD domain-containing protein, partial [Thermoplasmata archaeon]|nr:PKD domain-containing protein [Thermoplasmata archaeon]
YAWSFGDGASSALPNPSHIYTGVGAFVASLIVSDVNGSGSLATINVTVHEPSCAGNNLTVPLGQYQLCHLNRLQHATFTFVVTKQEWIDNAALAVYALDGTVNGTPPVFKLGTGLGGTPSLTSTGTEAGGPTGRSSVRPEGPADSVSSPHSRTAAWATGPRVRSSLHHRDPEVRVPRRRPPAHVPSSVRPLGRVRGPSHPRAPPPRGPLRPRRSAWRPDPRRGRSPGVSSPAE